MDKRYSHRENVELFHLLFMQQLGQKLDKRLYAVKGGCNLRFFLGSIRYSEDIDIDVHTVAVTTLHNIVNKILMARPFQQILAAQDISVHEVSTPKQTTTTQRWKIQLMIAEQSLPINTKIDFSRRQSDDEVLTEMVRQELISQYKLRPIFMSHYSATTALKQKVQALISRSETQARDIFDIYHLLQMHSIKEKPIFSAIDLQTAQEHLLSIGFAEFKAQVVSYLSPHDQTIYDDQHLWNEILTTVLRFLEE